ncbi:MAG TPA: regulatory protein GemA [Acidobacteriota bacterium]|nr:regulatory protein GemA [Acidobacteriota bacterium]
MNAVGAYEVKMIHIAKADLRLDEETYRDLLWSRYRVHSSKQLTMAQYQDLWHLFVQMGFVKKPTPGTKQGGTRSQVKEVLRLVRQHSVAPERLAGIVKHITGQDAAVKNPLKWLGTKELSKLIQALKRWKWEEGHG